MKYFIYFLLTIFLLNSCKSTKKLKAKEPMQNNEKETAKTSTQPLNKAKTDAYLQNILQADKELESFLSRADELNIQIIYSQITRDSANNAKTKDYFFNVNPAKYFYPASTVKFPVSVLALQRLNELNINGVNKFTTYISEAERKPQTAVFNDPTSLDGKPSIAHYIKKILLVSDNDAYNRLYEFLGQQYINQTLNRKGYDEVMLTHRLQQFNFGELDNRYTNPGFFCDDEGFILHNIKGQYCNLNYPKRNDTLGKAYYKGKELINKPLDFSKRNRISLNSLHQIMKSVLMPEAVSEKQRFNLTNEDREFLKTYMGMYPSECANPAYPVSKTEYYDTYCKFLYYGSENKPVNPDLRIYNKVGDAYGHLLDIAYFEDKKAGVEFMLSAVIYCNEDGILNDDKYDYDTVGFPFLKKLGQVIYQFEKQRKR